MRKWQVIYRADTFPGILLFLVLISAILHAAPLRSFENPAAICVSDSTTPLLRIAAERLLKWSEKYPVEKVHLHLDKSYYALSDTVWFKAYVTSGPNHHLSGLSRLLYIELIGPDNKLIKGQTLPVVSGTAWGDLSLAEPLVPGNYRIRAYTNWMRNAGEEFFLKGTLKLADTGKMKRNRIKR